MGVLSKRNSYETLLRLMKETYFSRWCNSLKAKLVIPHCLRHSILRLSHEGHIGIVKYQKQGLVNTY